MYGAKEMKIRNKIIIPWMAFLFKPYVDQKMSARDPFYSFNILNQKLIFNSEIYWLFRVFAPSPKSMITCLELYKGKSTSRKLERKARLCSAIIVYNS